MYSVVIGRRLVQLLAANHQTTSLAARVHLIIEVPGFPVAVKLRATVRLKAEMFHDLFPWGGALYEVDYPVWIGSVSVDRLSITGLSRNGEINDCITEACRHLVWQLLYRANVKPVKPVVCTLR